MKRHLANAAYGALDYMVYPAGMLVLAPSILHGLGIERFGVWAMANAALMTGAVLASGFGDANIRAVAQARESSPADDVVATVRSALGIHLALGGLIAAIGWGTARWMAEAVAKGDAAIVYDALWSLRIAAVLILVRAIETVCVSTQRAFGRYGAAIQVSVTARIASLILACLLPLLSRSASAVMFATLAVSCMALAVQMRKLMRLLGVRRLRPLYRGVMTRGLLGFGVFTWLQAVAGLLAGQVDRLVAGAALGASAVAAYACCVQLTQPIYGVTAAGLHFLFPLLSSDESRRDLKMLRRTVVMACAANLLFVLSALTILLAFGGTILRLWMGELIAVQAGSVLPIVAWGAALSALSVTGCYALLAAGRPASVAVLSIVGGAAMAIALTQSAHFGLRGIAYSRLLPGCVSMLVYIPLAPYLARRQSAGGAVEVASMLGKA